MHLPEAYCLDIERTVDIEEAYELFWEGQILDKRNFECADEDCDIQITAANLDKLRESMKRDPYFTTKNIHSPLCSYNPRNTRPQFSEKVRVKVLLTNLLRFISVPHDQSLTIKSRKKLTWSAHKQV